MARPKNPDLSAQRHSEILDAAARVFKRKGFHLARTEDICAEAGLSSGTVFRHFPSKQAMILEIVQAEFQLYHAEIRQLASQEGLEWLCQMSGEQLVELISPSCYALGTDSWLELSRDPSTREELIKLDRDLRSTLAQALLQGQAEGWVRPGIDPVGTANLILAVFTGMTFDAEVGVKLDTTATAAVLSSVFRNFILSPKDR